MATKRTASGIERQELRLGLLLIMPSLLLMAALVAYPLTYNVWLSLLDKHAFLPIEAFVGLRNYATLLTDAEFWSSLKNGLVYTASTIVLQIVLGVGTALVLHESFAGRNLLRGALLFPYLVPTIVVTILWRWLLNEQYGLVNFTLSGLGLIDGPVAWLGRDLVMLTVVWVSVWQFFPFVTLAVLGRLQSIPGERYEAASVDGAGAVRRFWHVTLPELKDILLVVILLRGIWMFTKFDTIWLLSGLEATGRYVQTLPILAYLKSFGSLEAGMGATIGMVMLIVQAVVAWIYLRLLHTEERA